MARSFSVQDLYVAARTVGCVTSDAAALAVMKIEGSGFTVDRRAPENLRSAIKNRSLQWQSILPTMPGIARTELQARKWFVSALGTDAVKEIEQAAAYGAEVPRNREFAVSGG